MKTFLYFIGKPRDAHANGMAAEFVKRASHYTQYEMREIDPRRFDLFARHPAAARFSSIRPAAASIPPALSNSSSGPKPLARSFFFWWAATMVYRPNGSRAPICCCHFRR